MSFDIKKITNSLNDFSFPMVLPSTGETIYGKPYIVKDQFKMAQIQDMKDEELLFKTILELIREKFYTLEESTIENLTLVDIQKMLIELKIQSDTVEIPIKITCTEDEYVFDAKINLREITIKNKENFTKMIEVVNERLQNKLIIEMKPISFVNYVRIFGKNLKKEVTTDNIKEIFYSMINRVIYGEEILLKSEIKKEDLILLIENLPKKYFDEVEKYIENLPSLEYDKKFICPNPNCRHHNIIDVNDFFYLFF